MKVEIGVRLTRCVKSVEFNDLSVRSMPHIGAADANATGGQCALACGYCSVGGRNESQHDAIRTAFSALSPRQQEGSRPTARGGAASRNHDLQVPRFCWRLHVPALLLLLLLLSVPQGERL